MDITHKREGFNESTSNNIHINPEKKTSIGYPKLI